MAAAKTKADFITEELIVHVNFFLILCCDLDKNRRQVLFHKTCFDVAHIVKSIKAKFFRLSHDVVTCDVDRDVSTAYCKSSSGDGVDWSCVILECGKVYMEDQCKTELRSMTEISDSPVLRHPPFQSTPTTPDTSHSGTK